MDRSVVTVFGGSGFIGRHLVQRLAGKGALIRVAIRHPNRAYYLQPLGDVGQIVPTAADVTDPASVAAAVADADAVVNLVGILFERGRSTFQRVHAEGAANVAEAASAAGVAKLVHISAIGADDDSPADYGTTKAAGENAVRRIFPSATVLRPSVVFGPEDGFFNRFAALARLSPVLPVFGCPPIPTVSLFTEGAAVKLDLYGDGGTRFQPVYVGNVADAIMRVLADESTTGKVFELGGPQVFSFKELMELVLSETGRRCFLGPTPFAIARIQAWFLEKLPNPLLTRDQLKLLHRDNVVSADAYTLADLGIEATPAETVLPTYLHRFRTPGTYTPREA